MNENKNIAIGISHLNDTTTGGPGVRIGKNTTAEHFLEDAKYHLDKMLANLEEAEKIGVTKKSNVEMFDFLDMKIKEEEERIDLTDKIFEDLSADENISEELFDYFRDAGIDVDKMDEGILGTLVGGLAGFFIGPSIGKLIARALGVTKGILFDMFNSKLVGTALGVAIMKNFRKKKK